MTTATLHDLPDVDPLPLAVAPAFAVPNGLEIGLGLVGYLALPFVGLLDTAGGPGVLVAAIAPPLAALFLSVPSLLVGHQYLGLLASPGDMLRDIGQVFVRCGQLALGLVPAVGLYAATSSLGPVALMVALLAIGTTSVVLARRRIEQREASINPSPRGRLRMSALAIGWSALSLLVGARLGLELLTSLLD